MNRVKEINLGNHYRNNTTIAFPGLKDSYVDEGDRATKRYDP